MGRSPTCCRRAGATASSPQAHGVVGVGMSSRPVCTYDTAVAARLAESRPRCSINCDAFATDLPRTCRAAAARRPERPRPRGGRASRPRSMTRVSPRHCGRPAPDSDRPVARTPRPPAHRAVQRSRLDPVAGSLARGAKLGRRRRARTPQRPARRAGDRRAAPGRAPGRRTPPPPIRRAARPRARWESWASCSMFPYGPRARQLRAILMSWCPSPCGIPADPHAPPGRDSRARATGQSLQPGVLIISVTRTEI
jgi:hypothetical protein